MDSLSFAKKNFTKEREILCVILYDGLRRYAIGSFAVKLCRRNGCCAFIQSEADGNGVIDLLHKYVVNMSHFFSETGLVNGTYLFQKNYRILDESEALGINVNMRGQFCFSQTAGNGGGNDGWTVFVSDIILNDENGTESALFASDDRTQIRIINISSFYGQFDPFFLFFTMVLKYFGTKPPKQIGVLARIPIVTVFRGFLIGKRQENACQIFRKSEHFRLPVLVYFRRSRFDTRKIKKFSQFSSNGYIWRSVRLLRALPLSEIAHRRKQQDRK